MGRRGGGGGGGKVLSTIDGKAKLAKAGNRWSELEAPGQSP